MKNFKAVIKISHKKVDKEQYLEKIFVGTIEERVNQKQTVKLVFKNF